MTAADLCTIFIIGIVLCVQNILYCLATELYTKQSCGSLFPMCTLIIIIWVCCPWILYFTHCTHMRARAYTACFIFTMYKWMKCQSNRTFLAKNSILDNTMEVDGTACPNAKNCLGMYTWI